jgi:hypothetical protein
MEKLIVYAVVGWIALNAVVVTAVLTRRSRPHLRQRLFRWVIGDRAPVPTRQSAHNLIMAHRRHH